jgi:signal transduction histidine kinase
MRRMPEIRDRIRVRTTREDPLREEMARLRARVAELEGATLHNEDALATVFSMLSHELRSPLQSLLLNVALCTERLLRSQLGNDGSDGNDRDDHDWLVERLDRQRRMANRLKLLIDTFLDVGQISAGKLAFDLQSVDLGELVTDVVRRGRDDLSWAGCALTLKALPGVIGRWDPVQVEVVITNLVSNAVKYGAGRPIEVTVWGSPETGFLRVRDQGPGIARADQGRIFEKFSRLASPARVSGFGLGLWIVKHIVQASSGTIELDSEVGRGASFLVALPRDQGGPISR